MKSQFLFVDLFIIIFYHTDFKKSIYFPLILGIVRGCCLLNSCVLLYRTWALAPGLSFPYPSRRFTTPHTPRPAPIATTRVFKVVIALLKNAIYIHQNWLLSGVYGNEKTPTKKPAHLMSVIPFLIIFRSFPRLLRQFYMNHFHLFFGFRCVLRI